MEFGMEGRSDNNDSQSADDSDSGKSQIAVETTRGASSESSQNATPNIVEDGESDNQDMDAQRLATMSLASLLMASNNKPSATAQSQPPANQTGAGFSSSNSSSIPLNPRTQRQNSAQPTLESKAEDKAAPFIPGAPSQAGSFSLLNSGYAQAKQTSMTSMTSSSSSSGSSMATRLRAAKAARQRANLQYTHMAATSAEDCTVNNRFTCSLSNLVRSFPTTVDASSLLRGFCESTERIADLALEEGFEVPEFSVNRHAVPGNAVFDRFLKAVGEENYRNDKDATVELVFHGTRSENIDNILENGLDPKRRRGQAHGPGEYFSRRPGLSASYCHGGNKMLVFCVVVPESCRKHKEVVDSQPPASIPFPSFGSLLQPASTDIPPSYVVVPTIAHQVPLGVVTFKGLCQYAMDYSRKMRLNLKQLGDEVDRKKRKEQEAEIKAKIIQYLIKKCIDTAGSTYEKNQDKLSHLSKREIAMYANRMYDEEVVQFYFPDLPPPMSVAEHGKEEILSVDKTRQEVSDAKQAYSDAVAEARKTGSVG
uniref:PARP catalytic domain-containing protein n=1 Tax=Entomoneis paludosa TaxID=265537 RepID=A0A7S3DQU0_9STRA|mmetsp:Transcript_28656/g.59884  ORF Transcript_28656/g.59884 Transcript_28656/m.59884 type:complete len:538 (+) Transcript_28656:102-1715(+)